MITCSEMSKINTTDKYIFEKSGGPKKAVKKITRRRNPFYEKPKRVLEPRITEEWYGQLVDRLVSARHRQHLSQMEVAQKLHSRQSVISDFERKLTNPSVLFLRRYAAIFDYEIEINLRQN
jgi:ribosome-binding protein aMBF1 (putative translation factor)